MEPEQPSPVEEHEPLHEEPHLPAPTIWPVGFAIGIVVALVGLIIDPVLVSSLGGADRHRLRLPLGARGDCRAARRAGSRGAGAASGGPAEVPVVTVEPAGVTRSRFLEGATLGLGGVIGGLITVPVAGFALLPSFLGQPETRSTSARSRSSRSASGSSPRSSAIRWRARYRGAPPSSATTGRSQSASKQEPSFTIISNHCVHLGCPVQANGPTASYIGKSIEHEHTANGRVRLEPVIPAGYGCPCHGGQYDPEGNRTAGPPVRALDRYDFEIDNGRLVLLGTYSVSHVVGTGATAKIYKYKEAGPGEHIDGPEQWFYPLQPPHH